MLKVINRADEVKNEEASVIDLLEETLERVKSGDLVGRNKCIVILVDDCLDSFENFHIYHGRATHIMSYLEITKIAILQEMGIL